jgi:hypothetical protein
LSTIVNDQVGEGGAREALGEGLKFGVIDRVLAMGWRDNASTLNQGLEWVLWGQKITENALDDFFGGFFDRFEELLFDG